MNNHLSKVEQDIVEEIFLDRGWRGVGRGKGRVGGKNEIQCYQCDQFGHISSNYQQNNHQASFMNDGKGESFMFMM